MEKKLFLPPLNTCDERRVKLSFEKWKKIYCSRKPHKIEKNAAELIKKERFVQ